MCVCLCMFTEALSQCVSESGMEVWGTCTHLLGVCTHEVGGARAGGWVLGGWYWDHRSILTSLCL